MYIGQRMRSQPRQNKLAFKISLYLQDVQIYLQMIIKFQKNNKMKGIRNNSKQWFPFYCITICDICPSHTSPRQQSWQMAGNYIKTLRVLNNP